MDNVHKEAIPELKELFRKYQGKSKKLITNFMALNEDDSDQMIGFMENVMALFISHTLKSAHKRGNEYMTVDAMIEMCIESLQYCVVDLHQSKMALKTLGVRQ